MAEERDAWAKAETVAQIVSAIFLPLVLLWLGTWISERQTRDDQARNQAEANATRLTTLMQGLSSENARERLLATRITEYFGTHDQLPAELVPALTEISLKDPNKEVSESAFQSLNATAKSNPELAPVINRALGEQPARVYIQIADDHQRDKAKQVQQKLTELGFVAPGVENVTGKANVPGKTDVRYYHAEDKPSADKVVDTLHSLGLISASASQLNVKNVRPGTLEIWFSRQDQ